MLTRFPRLPWLTCILAGALIVRLGAAWFVQQWVDRTPGRICLIEGDAEGYWTLAQHLARGEAFAIYDPPRYAMRMPGFPLLLAGGMKIFGENVLWARAMLAVVGTAACGLVYLLGRELVDSQTGLVACFLAAISPAFVGFSVLLLSETLFAAALLASVVAMARVVKTCGWHAQSGAMGVAPSSAIEPPTPFQWSGRATSPRSSQVFWRV